jgi:uncharacterized protein YdbL (DUF1318 family)
MSARAPGKWIWISAVAVFCACSIKAPEVRLTGEKTSLEKEILGTYHLMREDTWMVASTRAVTAVPEGPAAAMSPEKKRSLDALRDQEFNKDDVDEFKRNGFVGETKDGRLEARPSEELSRIPDTAKLVDEIVQEENAGRRIIMERVVELNDALKRAVPGDVSAVFAKMYQENSPAGSWIQKPDGSWVKK